MQLELFSAPADRWWLGEGEKAQAERLGWERRALSDMAAGGGSLVYCCPGFMGAVCERLVAKGLATKEAAGFLDPPAGVTPRQLKKWGWRAEDHRLFRYTLSTGAAPKASPLGTERSEVPGGHK